MARDREISVKKIGMMTCRVLTSVLPTNTAEKRQGRMLGLANREAEAGGGYLDGGGWERRSGGE